MAIRLHCDRCLRFVTTINDVKSINDIKKEVICKHCEKVEEKMVRLAETIRTMCNEKANALIEEIKESIREDVSKIKAGYGKED